MRRAIVVVALAGLSVAAVALAQDKKQDREAKVRSDKERIEADAKWIYDDLPRGIEEAKKSGKPLLVVFRCIPCEACAKLDEDVVTREPLVADLLDKFVCVRIPHANGMDLSLFQFDYDQSWAAFFLNADMTIYGRYGTRSSRQDSADDVSLEGFAKALQGALEVHAGYPDNKRSLRTKQSMAPAMTPEQYPSLRGKYTGTLDWSGKVVPSCIHCHQIAEAQRLHYRDQRAAILPDLVHAYPNPKVFGLVLDPKERARVRSVIAGSSAELAGFQVGDDVVTLESAPILSIADVQWVLNRSMPDYPARVLRAGKEVDLTWKVPSRSSDWWRRDDISWRASSWDLRRMVTGGMLLEDVSDEDRAKLGIDKTSMALRAKHVGQYGEHAAAKNAGFLKGDVLVAIASDANRQTESELLTSLVATTKAGDKLAVTVLREGKKIELTLPMQ